MWLTTVHWVGGQAYYFPGCQREHVVAHSCRNRHCPHCQGAQAVDWLAQQAAALLPFPYFHLVFTLPHTLNGLIRQNRAAQIARDRRLGHHASIDAEQATSETLHARVHFGI